jgi:protein-ribulosamine 3-kinase
MILPVALLDSITTFLRNKFSDRLSITGFQPLAGGSINHAGALLTTDGNFFLKFNSEHVYPGMFDAEARGLKLLATTAAINVPSVIDVLKAAQYQCIILSLVEHGTESKNFWPTFGHRLAQLHKHSQVAFGLDHDNYIGSLKQNNATSFDWIEFFIEKRLRAQLACSLASLDPSDVKNFELLFQRLPSILHKEKPALLHGDLWRGNVINDNGHPCLIDPAVYYGHREVDLAMTQLFGGFDPVFFEAYHEAFPLENGWRDRLHIYNLYALLVHFNLFGHSYLGQIRDILKRFV